VPEGCLKACDDGEEKATTMAKLVLAASSPDVSSVRDFWRESSLVRTEF